MNFENMELDELKDYAKSLGITFGKIGKDKLIEKIKEKENESSTVMSVIDDDDLEETVNVETNEVVEEVTAPTSLLDSITSAIDDLDDATGGELQEIVDLPMDYTLNVKSITYGGLTYKSR